MYNNRRWFKLFSFVLSNKLFYGGYNTEKIYYLGLLFAKISNYSKKFYKLKLKYNIKT